MKKIEEDLFSEAINDFIRLSKGNISDLHDLLIRGGLGKSLRQPRKGWSDIDLSIIVEKINSSVLKEVRDIYQLLKRKYSIKITITLVSRNDFLSKRHHHGMKPIFYSHYGLEQSISLFNNEIKFGDKVDERELRLDTISNVCYLIHDLRNRYMELENSTDAIATYAKHLMRRSNHLIKNCIYIKAGVLLEEDIDQDLLYRCFPSIPFKNIQLIEGYKASWETIKNDRKELKRIIDVLQEINEEIFENTLIDINNL
ncbi:MAG: hypothetical protein EBT45_01740 [Alphaproteobacteria bacterium]|nr:hypothetical protein [Alphaproteobacteria bacterium]